MTGTNEAFLEDRDVPFTVIKGVAAIDTEGYDVAQIVNTDNELCINLFGTDSNGIVEASPIHNIDQETSYPRFFIANRGVMY